MRGSRFHTTTLGPRGRGSRALVGNALYHTVGDREEAVKQLGLGFDQAYIEIANAIGVLPYEGSAERVKKHPIEYAWWNAAVAPLMAAWAKFKSAQLTGGGVGGNAGGYIAYNERFETNWPVYEEWQRKLESLRGGAKAMGIKLATPAPAPLPTTIVQDVSHAVEHVASSAANAAGDVWNLGKVAVYGGLAVLGAVAVGSLVSNMKSGKDPAANYLALARRKR